MKQNSPTPNLIHHHVSAHNKKFLVFGIFLGLIFAVVLFFKLKLPTVEITDEQRTEAVSKNIENNFQFLEQKASVIPETDQKN